MWQFPEVFICADDYALHEGISQGICELFTMQRLSGTSVMTNMPRWVQDAPYLKSFIGQGVQIGLHLNLTEGVPLTSAPSLAPDGQFRPLNDQLKAVLKGLLKPKDIAAEIHAQLQVFVDVWGAMPDFIDGHQHIHAVPIIRTELFAVIDEFVERYSKTPWVRVPNDTHVAIFSRPEMIKAQMVRLFAGGMAAQADVHGVPYNIGFSGFSGFAYTTPEQYRRLFLKCLHNLGSRPLIMCHPSAACNAQDAILQARLAEFAYFKSDKFVEDMAALTQSPQSTSSQHTPN